ncbi:hypothetical protein, partial [Pantoea sp. A4]|uniref:hypothetical protein n=1 Tax=Pantoea sp. A4 TaxID=1225184 RepID=UPI001ED9B669
QLSYSRNIFTFNSSLRDALRVLIFTRRTEINSSSVRGAHYTRILLLCKSLKAKFCAFCLFAA